MHARSGLCLWKPLFELIDDSFCRLALIGRHDLEVMLARVEALRRIRPTDADA
jgi:hypothetical protein